MTFFVSSISYVPTDLSLFLGSNISGSKTFSARVVFLDDTCQTFEVDKRAKGQFLIDTVFR